MSKRNVLLVAGLSLGLGLAGGYWFAAQAGATPSTLVVEPDQYRPEERQALYWYDPMYPQQKFDKPGKSPFMDMQLVPQYASGSGDAAVLNIDPSLTQNLGMRLGTVTRGTLDSTLDVTGLLAFNERDVAVVQARAVGRHPGAGMGGCSDRVSRPQGQW
jgi:Cu(I)/Ag(I) efflux system membrane fusion protein